ncbi:MAG: transglutaminase family protein [Opitutales bacterium]|jgi:regulator of sirC expression with transglutaminase-like and TPR domain
MTTEALPPASAEALLRLLDDTAPQVREALLEEFRRLGEPGLGLLRQAAESGEPGLAGHARHFLRELGGEDTVATFLEFVRSFQYELETGLLLLERTVFPALGAAETHGFLDAAAARCRQLLLTPATAREKCLVVSRVLFHEFGFRGDAENYHDPRNSFMHLVIQRRRGIPLTLCALYILVGQRCGIELEPIALPGRFMVGCFLDDEPFFIDAYERGVFRDEEDVREHFRRLEMPFEPATLMPAPVGEVLARCCRNLVNQYTAARDHAKAKLFAEFVHEFELTYRRHAEPT